VASFPIVGFVAGLAAYVLIWFVFRFGSQLAGAVISGILAALFIEALTMGKNLSALAIFLESKLGGLKDSRVVSEIDRSSAVSNDMGLFILVSLFLLRIACIAILAGSQYYSWIIVTMTAAYASQAALVISRDARTGEKFFDADINGPRLAWLIALVLSAVAGGSIAAAVVTMLIVYAATMFFKNYCENRLGGVSGQIIGMVGSAMELIVLVAGIIFLVKA
jgi:cobalamin synthase